MSRPWWWGAGGMAAVEGVSLLVAFLAQPYLMRTLGPAAFGTYVLACAAGLLAATITDFGFNYAGVREALALRDDAAASHRLFWRVQLAKLVVGLACAAAGLLLAHANGGPLPLAGAVALGAASALLFPAWHLLAVGRAVLLSLALLAGRLISLAGLLLFVRGSEDLAAAVAWTLAAPLLAAPLTLADATLRGHLRWVAVGPREVWSALRLGSATAWIAVLPTATSALVQSLIAGLASTSTLGVYAAADKLRSALQGLFVAFGVAAFPASVAAAGRANTTRAAGGALWPHALLAAAVAVPLAMLAEPVVATVSGPGFEAAAPVLVVLSLALVTGTMLQASGVQWLLPAGRAGLYAAAAAVGLAVHLLALFWCVPAGGARGAAWAMVGGDLAALAAIGLWSAVRLPRGEQT